MAGFSVVSNNQVMISGNRHTPAPPKSAPFVGPVGLNLTKPFPVQPARSVSKVRLCLSSSCLFPSLFKPGRSGRRWRERIHGRDAFP